MDLKKITNLSKRQQITASSKTVFIWFSGAAILVAFSAIAVVFMVRQLKFTEQVLATKSQTNKNLNSNIQAAAELKDNVNLLLSNTQLNSVKTDSDSSNLQVIFDALPTSYDSANFGASLQGVLLNGTVASIENLTVASPNDASSGDGTSTGAGVAGTNAVAMPFSFTVTGSAAQIQTVLTNLEQSIRPIKVTALTIDGGTPLTARVAGETYYDPSVNLTLGTKAVKP